MQDVLSLITANLQNKDLKSLLTLSTDLNTRLEQVRLDRLLCLPIIPAELELYATQNNKDFLVGIQAYPLEYEIEDRIVNKESGGYGDVMVEKRMLIKYFATTGKITYFYSYILLDGGPYLLEGQYHRELEIEAGALTQELEREMYRLNEIEELDLDDLLIAEEDVVTRRVVKRDGFHYRLYLELHNSYVEEEVVRFVLAARTGLPKQDIPASYVALHTDKVYLAPNLLTLASTE